MSFQEAYHVTGQPQTLEAVVRDELDSDPRGIVWIWEPPEPRASYVMGIDPTVGIPNWHRALRTQDDADIDNAAIGIIRIGARGKPDVQVAEYAAPIDSEDLAAVANFLGRMYCGNAEDAQALCIIEVWPGPGLLTLRRMINEFGYTRHFTWKYLDKFSPHQTTSLGWTSSAKSVRDLWIRGNRHIALGRIVLRSPWLVEEFADAEPDMAKMTFKAQYGSHDDRVRATLMAIWAAHDWSLQADIPESPQKVEPGRKSLDWRATDCTLDEMMEEWEDQFDRMQEGSQA